MENYRESVIKFFRILKIKMKVFVITFVILLLTIAIITFAFYKKTYKSSFYIKATTYDDEKNKVPKLSYAETEKAIADFNYFLKYNPVNNGIAECYDTISLSSLRNDEGAMEVVMEIYDTNKINQFKDMFIKYINENNYIKTGMENLRKEYNSMIANLDAQIANLNSNIANGKNLYFDIYHDIAILKEKRTAAEYFIKNNTGIIVTVEPNKPKPENISKAGFIILSVIFSFFASILVVFISYSFSDKNK
jgi:hypothetical protein